jgi:hypothetical protein
MEKICRNCKTLKSLDDFPLFSTSEAGRKNTCGVCANKLSVVRKRLKAENPPPPPGQCPICKLNTDCWILDHCHFNHSFRGYICNSCNLALGRFNDDPAILENALRYLVSTSFQSQDL